MIRVQTQDFDIGAEIAALKAKPHGYRRHRHLHRHGARPRRNHRRDDARALSRHDGSRARAHRAGSPRALAAASRLIVHRTGTLKPGDNIVLVITASAHRDAAFEAAKFLMDYLKTSAPFWKRESGPQGSRWVEAKADDEAARIRWSPRKDAAE